MMFKTVKDAPFEKNQHNVEVLKSDDQNLFQAKQNALKPNQSLKSHIAPVVILSYVSDGTLDIHIDNYTVGFEKYSLEESHNDIVFCISNPAGTNFCIPAGNTPTQTGKNILL